MSHEQSVSLDFALKIDFGGILTNPILDIAARVWEEERYEAFTVCYRSMRRIDDLVDDLKSQHGAVPAALAVRAESEISNWLAAVSSGQVTDEYGQKFVATLDRFSIPLWPWERLGQAMIYDLKHRGFANFRTFLRYTEGAAISPAAVFMHLCGVGKVDDRYQVPSYDIRLAARHLAIFSYVTHILRDFQKDQKAGLNYFADSILAHAKISESEFHDAAVSGQADARVREVIRVYYAIGIRYQKWARGVVDATLPQLAPRYQLSLELIYNLYSQIFAKVDPRTGLFTTEALNPTPAEVEAEVKKTIETFRPVFGAPPTSNRIRG